MTFDRNSSLPVQSEFTWYVPVRVRRMICPPKLLTSDGVSPNVAAAMRMFHLARSRLPN